MVSTSVVTSSERAGKALSLRRRILSQVGCGEFEARTSDSRSATRDALSPLPRYTSIADQLALMPKAPGSREPCLAEHRDPSAVALFRSPHGPGGDRPSVFEVAKFGAASGCRRCVTVRIAERNRQSQ